MGGLLFATIAGSAYWIDRLQDNISTLKGNQIILETKIQEQNEAIENYLISSTKDLARIVTKSKTRDDDQKQSISAVGVKFQVTSKSQPNADVKTKITIIGNETGGSTTIDVTVNKTVIPVT